MSARLAPDPFDAADELAALVTLAPAAGAIVSFVGIARPTAADGGSIERLVLEHHPRLTAVSLELIAADALARFALTHVRVVHRCGSIAPGEPIVFAAAAAAHRRAAFDATDYLMDRLKSDAIFWKREEGPAGSTWIEPTATDRADLKRWSEPCPE